MAITNILARRCLGPTRQPCVVTREISRLRAVLLDHLEHGVSERLALEVVRLS